MKTKNNPYPNVSPMIVAVWLENQDKKKYPYGLPKDSRIVRNFIKRMNWARPVRVGVFISGIVILFGSIFTGLIFYKLPPFPLLIIMFIGIVLMFIPLIIFQKTSEFIRTLRELSIKLKDPEIDFSKWKPIEDKLLDYAKTYHKATFRGKKKIHAQFEAKRLLKEMSELITFCNKNFPGLLRRSLSGYLDLASQSFELDYQI